MIVFMSAQLSCWVFVYLSCCTIQGCRAQLATDTLVFLISFALSIWACKSVSGWNSEFLIPGSCVWSRGEACNSCRARTLALCRCAVCSATRFYTCNHMYIACDLHQNVNNDALRLNRDAHQLRPCPILLWVVAPQNHGEPIRQEISLTCQGTEVWLMKHILIGLHYFPYMERCCTC